MNETGFGGPENSLRNNRRDLKRHARRGAYEEQLSSEAIEDIRLEAQETFDDIMRHSSGSVFYVMSSHTQRAVDTRKHLERALRDVVREQDERSIEFVDYTGAEKMKSIANNDSKRWVITNLPDSPELGIAEGNDIGETWNRMQGELRDMAKKPKEMAMVVHNLLSKITVTRKHELRQLVREMRPYIDTSVYTDEDILESFDPALFLKSETLEDQAADQLEAFAREAQYLEDRFPGQHVHGITIAHAPVIDYITMGLMGMDINLKNWNAMGGIRNFLESAQFDFDQEGNLITAEFRGKHLSTSAPVRISDVIARLRSQGRERRAEWGL